MNGHPDFHRILDEMREVHERKSADYGTGEDPFANVRASAQWGIPAWVGTMIRATDKVIRLQSLYVKGSLQNESARDSLIDLASYAIIALILMDEENEQKEMAVLRQLFEAKSYPDKVYDWADDIDDDGMC